MYLTPEILLGDLRDWELRHRAIPDFSQLDGGKPGGKLSKDAMRREWRKQRRRLFDMPPRGLYKLWQRAYLHGSTIPEDAIRFYLCKAHRHRFFFIGPSIEFRGMQILRLDNPGYEALPVEVLCDCGAGYLAQIPLPRPTQLALRAAWRIGGEPAVQEGLAQLPGECECEVHATVRLARFRYFGQYSEITTKWTRWSDGFPPTSMYEQIVDTSRRVR